MRMRHLPVISLVVMVLVAIGWQIEMNRSYERGREAAAQRKAALEASFPVVPVRPEQPGDAATEAEKKLGPFSIGGKNYVVVLQKKPRVPGSTKETGDTVVSMEIRDSGGRAVYKRAFPMQSDTDTFSDAWDVAAKVVTRGNGSGLLINYSVDAEPSDTAPEDTTWWQLFGSVNGEFRPFSGPIAVEGEFVDSHSDTLDFRVWAHRASVMFPVRIDWMQGRLIPERNCVVIPCEFKAIPKEISHREDLTFVRLCAGPDQCGNRERVVVKKDSIVEVLLCRAQVHWKEGTAQGPSPGNNNAMNDAGEITIPEQGDLWVKVRIDGKEGWLHDEEDFMSLGMVFEQ